LSYYLVTVRVKGLWLNDFYRKAEVWFNTFTPCNCVVLRLTASTVAIEQTLHPLDELQIILILALAELFYLYFFNKTDIFLGQYILI
jgi:hypothetical protein